MQRDVSVCGMSRCNVKPTHVTTLENGPYVTTKALCDAHHVIAEQLSDADVVKIVHDDKID